MEADVVIEVTLELGLKSIILTCSLCPLPPTSVEFTFILFIMMVPRHVVCYQSHLNHEGLTLLPH